MTQRQRRYWKAFYKYSNYMSLAKAIKLEVPEYKTKCAVKYIEGLTVELETRCHELYLLCKSSGAIRSANKISATKLLTDNEIKDLLITENEYHYTNGDRVEGAFEVTPDEPYEERESDDND